MDVVYSPHVTAVCGSNTDTCQLNTDVHRRNAASGFELCSTLPAVNVSRSSPVSEITQCVVSAAGQSQLGPLSCPIEDQSVDEQRHPIHYSFADVSSVLTDQTLVSSQTPCADAAQLTQYPLCDSSSDASLPAGELVSLLQFPLDNSPDNVTAASRREVDNAAALDTGNSESGVELQESTVQRDDVALQQPSVAHSSLSVSADDVNAADQHGSSCVTFSNADVAVNICSIQPLNSQGNMYDSDTDLLVSLSTGSKTSSVLCSLSPTNDADFNKTVASNKTAESDDKCSSSGTSSSHTKQRDDRGTPTDKTGLGSTVLTTVNAQLGRGKVVTVTDDKTVPAEAKTVDIVMDLQSVSSSAIAVSKPGTDYMVQPSDNKLPDSGRASVELGCTGQLDVVNDACKMSDMFAVVDGSGLVLPTALEMAPDHKADTTSDSVVRMSVGMTGDKEQTGQQMIEASSSDNTKSLRNAADGSETSDILLSAVQMSLNNSRVTAARNGPSTHCGIVTGSYDSVSSQSVPTEHNITVMSDSHRPHDSVISDANRDKTEILADIESEAQHSTAVTRRPSDMTQFDLALPLEQDNRSEIDEDDLVDNVKMILAKYRIRRGPIGSDSMPVASSAKSSDALMLDTDSLLHSGKQKDDVIDVDTCSDSSDDTLAMRVKALLIKGHRETSSKLLPTTTSNVTSQNTSKVPSVCSSRNTSVDYDILSRELNEIQLKLDSMRNSETSSLGSRCSSSASPCTHSPVTDVSAMQESLGVLVQQKTHVDQLLQRSVVGHAGDVLHVDHRGFVSKADAATSDVKHVDADTLRRELVLSGQQHQMLSTSGAEPLTDLKAELDKDHCRDSGALVSRDLLQTTTDSVQRPVQPAVSSSNSTSFSLTSVSSTKVADILASLSGESLSKSFESLASRSDLLSTVEDTMSSTGSRNQQHVCARKLPVGQNVNVTDSNRDVQDSSAAEDILQDTVSEVSSLQTDMHQSESTSYTQLDDWRLASSRSISVEAAVKQLEQSLAKVIQTDRPGNSSTSNVYSYLREEELLKQSSVEGTVNQQIPALSDDEYCLSEPTQPRLSHSYSDSCGLSPVSKHGPFDIMRSVHPLLATQLDKATAARFDQSTELSSPAASNVRCVTQSFNRNVQPAENSSQLGIEHEKQNDYKIPNWSVPSTGTSRSPSYMLKSYSGGSSEQTTFNEPFVSTDHLPFTPLAVLPCRRDSSVSGSYDGDNEEPLTDRQSNDGDGELRSCSGAVVEQHLAADRTVSSYDVDISASCWDAVRSTQTVVSHSPADVNVLQPYQ